MIALLIGSAWGCSPDTQVDAGFLQAEWEEVRRVELEETDSAFIGRLIQSNMVSFSPEGRIAVADGMTQRILLFGPDGRLERVGGGRGEGPGEFQTMFGLAWDQHGFIWAIDYSRRISIFDGGLSLDTTFTIDQGPPTRIQMTSGRALIRVNREPRFDGPPIFVYDVEQRAVVDSLFGHGPLAGSPYVPYSTIYRVRDDTVLAGASVSYPLKVLSTQGDTLAVFGTAPPSLGTMRIPEYAEFVANMPAASEWRRSFGTLNAIWVAHDSLVVAQHYVPSAVEAGSTGRLADIYDRRTLEKLAEDVEVPGLVVSTHDDLVWILTHEPPSPWTFTGFRLHLR